MNYWPETVVMVLGRVTDEIWHLQGVRNLSWGHLDPSWARGALLQMSIVARQSEGLGLNSKS